MTLEATPQTLTGWGRTAPTAARVLRVASADEAAVAVKSAGDRGVVVRGMGSSYGDAAQNAGGLVLDLRGMDTVLDLHIGAAAVRVEAGITLDRLMRLLVPLGFFLPVTPGTRWVTVGGAIAADVHGKNHPAAGSFCSSVVSMDVLTADGVVRTVSPASDPDLFWATAGGMGLTGVILRATLRLLPIRTSRMLVDTERIADLDALLDRLAHSEAPYSIAWIDLLASGASLGRSVLTSGRHADVDDLPGNLRRDPLRFAPRVRLGAPPWVPPGLLNRTSVRAFNEAYFRRAPQERHDEVQDLAAFFHPLDGVARWNLMYGPRGFVQYQFVVPTGQAEALREVIDVIREAGAAPFLATLKRLGVADPGPLSFPMPGWVLALDLPLRPALAALLGRLDELVAGAGGRVYLAKDSWLSPSSLTAMYPRLDQWLEVRRRVDPARVLRSDLSRRLDL